MRHPGVALEHVVANQDLAVAGAVKLDARIPFPAANRRHISEEHAPPGPAQNLARARVIRRVVAEGLGRTAGFHEGLRNPERRPRLGAARLHHQRNLQRDGRHPERMNARRIAREDHAERVGPRVEAQDMAFVLTVAGVEHREIQAARESPQHRLHLTHHAGDALHVPAHERVRHPGRCRQLQHVVGRRLLTIAERQRVVQEMIRGFAAHRDQPRERHPRQLLSRRRLPLRPQVAPDQAGVRLADFDEWLARLIVRHGDDVEALVGNAVAEDGEVEHRDESTSLPTLPRCHHRAHNFRLKP